MILIQVQVTLLIALVYIHYELENAKVFDNYLLILKGSNGIFTRQISWETINKMSDESHVVTLEVSTYKED